MSKPRASEDTFSWVAHFKNENLSECAKAQPLLHFVSEVPPLSPSEKRNSEPL